MTKDELRDYLLKHQDATELDLMEKDLTKLPPEIGKLSNLQELSLGNNSLKILPPEIGLLANLKVLDLTRTHFKTALRR
jgi:leucine-rich repeat protein SHOC2